MSTRKLFLTTFLVVLLGALAAQPAQGHSRPAMPEPPAEGVGRDRQVAAVAGSPLGSDFPIRNDAGLAEDRPAVAYNSQRQEYLVVWYNDRAGCDDVQAQRVSRHGSLIGGPFYVSAGCPANRRYPDVAYNSQSDEYLVVWEQEEGSTPSVHSVHGRRVSATGQVLGTSDIVVASGTASFEGARTPAVAYASTSNKYLVVWEQDLISVYTHNIRGQVVSAAGVLDPASILISSDLGGGHPRSEPDLAYNRSRNEHLVVWQQYEPTGEYDVNARRVTGNGDLLNPESIGIMGSACDEESPAVAAVPTVPDQGAYVVLWEQSCSGGDKDIRSMPVTGTGTTGAVRTLASLSGWDEYNPAVAGNESSGQFLAVWTWLLSPAPPAMLQLYGQALDTNGDLVGGAVYAGGRQAINVDVAGGPAGDFLLAFDDTAPGTDRGIYGHLWGNRVYLPLVVRLL